MEWVALVKLRPGFVDRIASLNRVSMETARESNPIVTGMQSMQPSPENFGTLRQLRREGRMKQIFLLAVVFFVSSDQVWAQDGWYIGTDLGITIAPGMNVNGTDNDWSTKCDLITNPTQAEIGDGCTSAPPPTSWSNEVDGSRGMLAALAVGYRRGHLRVEGEYFYRTTSYDDYSPTRIAEPVNDNGTLYGIN